MPRGRDGEQKARPQPVDPYDYEVPWPTTGRARGGFLGVLGMLVPPLGRLLEAREKLLADRVDYRGRHNLLQLLLEEERERSNELMIELRRLRSRELLRDTSTTQHFSWLFILTYGRSGSTLLQGILNATPGVLVRGETGGMLTDLWKFHLDGLRHRDRLRSRRLVSPRHPWFGVDGYPVDAALDLMRLLVLETLIRPRPDTRIVGFKEIDWPTDELDDYIDFLSSIFPGVRFLINTRDLDVASTSGWWANRPDAKQHLAALEERYLAVHKRLGDRAFHVRFDDYIADPASLAPMFEWLRAPFDYDLIKRTIDIPHSYNTRLEVEGVDTAEEDPDLETL